MKYSMVIGLSGAKGIGNDNIGQIGGCWPAQVPASTENRERHPCYVFVLITTDQWLPPQANERSPTSGLILSDYLGGVLGGKTHLILPCRLYASSELSALKALDVGLPVNSSPG